MFTFARLGTFLIAVAMTSVAVAEVDQSAAPVPAQILASNKVFISNAGQDSASAAAFRREKDPDRPYNQFYAAVKSWGRYELVATPAEADLILEIRFTAPATPCGNTTCYAPQLGLAILDAKTHFTLWTLVEPVNGAFRKATWDKNVNQGMNNLIDDLKKLAGPSLSTSVSSKN